MTQSLFSLLGQRLQAWFGPAQDSDSREHLAELPDEITAQLKQKIQALPSPERHQTTVQEAVAAAVQTWQQNLEAPNSLVFLASPPEPMARLLTQSLQRWQNPPLPTLLPLPGLSRAGSPRTMTEQMQRLLEPYDQVDTAVASTNHSPLSDDLEGRRTLMVIPALEQCFLRRIGGWDGVEYLRDVVTHNRNCFWVIGCNQWAWRFLDIVCQVGAYFEDVKTLPTLDGATLKDWLDPIVKTVVDLDMSKSANRDDAEYPYWDALADEADGFSQVAASLWLKSLRLETDPNGNGALPPLDLAALGLDQSSAAHQAVALHETRPDLPSLPSLAAIDRYLLHSLLLHGEMTHAHLALSLGEPQSIIQPRVQWLLRQQVLTQQKAVLSVRAAYYPQLKTELANNNFFVGND